MENSNRPIRFRAWTDNLKNGGEMYYQREIENHQIAFSPAGYGINNPTLKIMQFTGLLDKTGKECFEGDLVKRCDGSICEIRYADDWAAFIFYNENKKGWKGRSHLHSGHKIEPWEVIGNIWENPELVK